MSSDPNDKIRLKCNVDGAGDYFIEPIQSDDIESIWRHTPPQREEKNINISSSPIPYLQAEENNRNPESLATINSGHFLPEIQRSIDDEVNKHLNGLTVSCSNSKVSKKRKEAEQQPQPQPPHDGSEAPEQYTTAKKQRLIWTQDLHSIFTTAVKNLTVEKAVPKKILEYMRGQGVIELTRENVASHLQKYRLFLRRKENDEKLSNLNSQSVSLNGSKQSNFRRSSPSDQISYHIENNSNCCSNPHFPLQNFSEHERSHIISNHAIDNVVPSLDQNRFFDQNMPHHSLHLTTQQQQRLPPPAQDRNCYVHLGGTVSSFQAMPSSFAPSTTPNMVPFSEIQRNDVLTMQNLQLKSEPMAQPLNGDDLLFEDISHPQFLSDHYFNVYGNGGLAPVKINSGGISVLCNDFFQGHHTNFIEDYENQQFDRFENTPESNFSSAFYYDHPTMSNSTLEMEMEFEQNRRTNFNPSNNNPPDNASM